VKLSRIKDLTKDAAVYGFGSVAVKVVGFLLIPVYTHYLSPADYGVLALITMYSSLVATVIGLGQHQAVFRYYFKYDEGDPRRRGVIRTFLALAAAMAVPCGLAALAARPLSRSLLDDAALAPLLAMGVGITYLDLVEKVPLVLIRAQRLAVRFATYTLIRTTTTICFVLFFVVAIHKKAEGVLSGQLLSGVLFTALLYVWMMRGVTPRYDREIGKQMLAFGLPLLPGLLLYFVFQNASRWFLQRYQGADAVGLFALAVQFGSILLLMNTAIQTAWPMFLYGAEKDEGVKGVYARALTYYLVVAGYVATGIVVFVPEVYRFMVEARFHPSMPVIPYTLLAVVLLGLHQFGGVGINLKEKTSWYVLVTGSSAATAVVLNFALVPRYSIMGAALATVFAYAVQAGMSLMISHRLYPVRYEVRRILTLAAVFCGVAWLTRVVPWPNLAAALAGKAVLLAAGIPLLLWLLRFQTEDEWRRVVQLLRRRRAATA